MLGGISVELAHDHEDSYQLLTDWVVSNDTGPIHIGAAAGTPVVDLYALGRVPPDAGARAAFELLTRPATAVTAR